MLTEPHRKFDHPNDYAHHHGENFCGAVPEGSKAYPRHCVHGSATGEQACCWCGDVFVAPNQATEHGKNFHPLTPRETEVIALIAEGFSNKMIATKIGVAEHTAKFHVRNAIKKLGQDTRAGAAADAVRRGII